MIIQMLVDATVVGTNTEVAFVLAHIESVSPRESGTHICLVSGAEWVVNERAVYFTDALEAYYAFTQRPLTQRR